MMRSERGRKLEMVKKYTETRIEVWNENYVNYPTLRAREDEDLVVVQAEYGGKGMYIVEVGREDELYEEY